MKLGFIGPATPGEEEALRDAAELLLVDLGAEQCLYLGEDPAVLEGMARAWYHELLRGEGDFWEQAQRAAQDGEPDSIEALLARDGEAAVVERLRHLPAAPARAVEFIGNRVILAVHDKDLLDEEDIVNTSIVVFGNASEPLLRRFGRRYFYSPGPLAQENVGLLELDDDGLVQLAAYRPSGEPLWREALLGKGAKLTVAT